MFTKYRINYRQVVSQANSVAEYARQLSAQIVQLEQMEQECRNAWQGDTANVFISKLCQLREEMNRTKRKMDNLSGTIKYCADIIQKADIQAAEEARNLSVGR